MGKLLQFAFVLMMAALPGRAELLQVDLSVHGMDWMTCAHIVNVALTKLAGVDTVDVSLNKSLATIRFKPGNTVSVPQLWQLIHSKGYTPKETVVSARGDILNVQGTLKIKLSGTNDVIALAADPKNPGVYAAAAGKAGTTVIVDGVMTPGKDLKVAGPLQITALK